MDDITPAEVLLRLLDACDASEDCAASLAGCAQSREWETFLRQSAKEYRTAADELRATLNGGPVPRAAAAHAMVDAGGQEHVAGSWERIECDALACFRDAFDSNLPPELQKIVRRHYEAGIARLERLREMQAQHH